MKLNCQFCSSHFEAMKISARYCSRRCRLRGWRRSLPNPPMQKGSLEHREKMRQIALANGSLPPSKKGWSPSNETRKRQSIAKKGKPKPWFVGRVLTEDHKEKIRRASIANETWRVLFEPDIRAKAIRASQIAERQRGHQHWNWKGGIPRHIPEKSTPAWKQWRRIVFERDNFQCQWCFTSSKLVPHHRWPRRLRPELIFDVTNGVTLCSECHPTAEKLFRSVESQLKDGAGQLLSIA